MKTKKITKKDLKRDWLVLDATGQSLGRLASEASRLLRGKHKAMYVPHLDCGDSVVIINASKINLTGKKLQDKFYHRHTGFIGGLKSQSAKDLFAKDPCKLVIKAVKGMLAKNKLRDPLMKHLKVYLDDNHPHAPQNPVEAPKRLKPH